MNTFYFNTGVKPENSSVLYGDQIWRGGVKQIPFECDAPENAIFQFACDFNNLPESKLNNWLVAEIKNPNESMLSKYAYFKRSIKC